MKIMAIDPGQASHLIRELDEYQESLYPAESNHLDSIPALKQPNVVFLGAMEDDEIMAIGAVKIFKEYGEIKRVYVSQAHRNKGLARKIMAELESILIDRGVLTAKLETGVHQPEALGLYRSLGYRECEPFGDYKPDPLSVFMGKGL